MLTNLKALIVILVLAGVTFHVCRPLLLQFMSQEAFARRRKVWFTLTVVAFLSPSFWPYAVVAFAVLAWNVTRDENPLALYVLCTFAIPDVKFYIPGGFVNQLFDLSQSRILSLALLIPVVVRGTALYPDGKRGLTLPDVFLAGFLLLQVVLLMPYESSTNTMRRTFLFLIDSFIVFYAFSRLDSRHRIGEVMACFFMSCAIMAPIAVFESLRGWLLYTNLAGYWGDPSRFSWLMRGESLRAQVAAGHSINFGYHMAMALGFYLYLFRRAGLSQFMRLAVLGLIALSILVTYSRAAWVTAVLVGVIFVLMRPNAMRYLPGTIMAMVVVVGLMYVSPLKESVIDRLPFLGTQDQDTVDYRQRLVETSWVLIQQNPFFGDPFVYLRMEDLRQGQGIIDIVNGYVMAALFTGLVGLSLLVGVFLSALNRGFTALVRWRSISEDAGLMGAALVASLVATLAYIATAGYSTTTYLLCALLLSYARSPAPEAAGAAAPELPRMRKTKPLAA